MPAANDTRSRAPHLPPEEAIHLLRLLTFSGSHPHISDGHVLSPQRIVDVLLDGISAQPSTVRRNSPP